MHATLASCFSQTSFEIEGSAQPVAPIPFHGGFRTNQASKINIGHVRHHIHVIDREDAYSRATLAKSGPSETSLASTTVSFGSCFRISSVELRSNSRENLA